MTDLDVLRDQLVRLSEPAPGRSAADIFDAARRQPMTERPRRRGAVAAIAAAVTIIAGLTTWQLWPSDATVTLTNPGEATPLVIPSIVVPVGGIDAVEIAFGRIWVASSSAGDATTTTIWAYDAATGEPVGTVARTEDGSALTGVTTRFAVTDHFIWVRTSAFPAHPERGASQPDIVYQLDPNSMSARANRHLDGVGPLVGNRDRIVAADSTHLEIIREDGVELGVPSLSEVVRAPDVGGTGTERIDNLHLNDRGLWATATNNASTTSPDQLMRLDPTTGAVLSATDVGTDQADPQSIAGEPIWWFASTSPPIGYHSQELVLWGARLDTANATLFSASFPGDMALVAEIDDRRVLVELRSSGLYGVLDTASGTFSASPATSDRSSPVATFLNETPILARWSTSSGPVTVDFWPVGHSIPPTPTSTTVAPLDTGLIDGFLEAVAGPLDPDDVADPRPMAGHVTVTKLGPVEQSNVTPLMITVGPSGRFRVPLPPGTYRVGGSCPVDEPVVVTAETTTIHAVCPLP